ncbi:hypothetical protein [Dongia mobilis]|jgi:hypothetical protein|uniref:hypothetical protein n=1 Tax=Dongia sp. TaxID=1977262 RepID=UPI0026F25C1F
MLRHFVFFLIALCLALSASAHADETATRWRINNIPLDMPLDEALNGEFLEGIYQEKLQDRLMYSVLTEWPSYHIHSTLKVGGKLAEIDAQQAVESDPRNEQMDLYFSSAADHRRLFWIRARKPIEGPADATGIAQTMQMVEASFGKPDRIVTAADWPGNAILIMVDPALGEAERSLMLAALPDPLTLGHDDFIEFWSMDLQRRAKLLGPNFRGAIVLLTAFQGRLQGLQTELLDLGRAQTVFNLAD